MSSPVSNTSLILLAHLAFAADCLKKQQSYMYSQGSSVPDTLEEVHKDTEKHDDPSSPLPCVDSIIKPIPDKTGGCYIPGDHDGKQV